MNAFVAVKSDGGDDPRVVFRGTLDACVVFLFLSWRIALRKYTADGAPTEEAHDNAIDTMASYNNATSDWEDAGTGEVWSIALADETRHLREALEPMPAPLAPLSGSLGERN